MLIVKDTYKSPLGEIVLAAQDGEVVGLWFNDQKHFPKDVESWVAQPDYPVLKELRVWLDGYFRGENPEISFALNFDALGHAGTEFRKKVWRVLREIPYGETITYGEIAKKLAQEDARAQVEKVKSKTQSFAKKATKDGQTKVSARAVGNAVGRNPISIVVPCHRVVGATGKLVGYAGGLDKKQKLLELERKNSGQ